MFDDRVQAQATGSDDLSIPGLTDGIPVAVPAPAEDTMATEADTSLLGLIAAGGWSMWVLGAFSLTLGGLTVYCAMDLRAVNFSPAELRDSLHAHVQSGNLESAFALARTDDTTLGRMVAKVGDQIEETGYSTEDNDMLRDLMAEAGVKTNRMRARVINYFSVLAQAAPMMGLLGTVSGMIKAFGTLQRKGMGNPSELAGN
ncbi:MAG: MotA/TolQ/ExbB proton channel family protein, partial [Verrucomicrobiae bacterium]|nr:MotA/TolQ/ExbB proton channel family protein [Verrucomicrobiae bacterium]